MFLEKEQNVKVSNTDKQSEINKLKQCLFVTSNINHS